MTRRVEEDNLISHDNGTGLGQVLIIHEEHRKNS